MEQISFEEAKQDVLEYLDSQSDEYFIEYGQTREIMQNDAVISAIAEEHMKCVNSFGNDRAWSVKDACDVEPGLNLNSFMPM